METAVFAFNAKRKIIFKNTLSIKYIRQLFRILNNLLNTRQIYAQSVVIIMHTIYKKGLVKKSINCCAILLFSTILFSATFFSKKIMAQPKISVQHQRNDQDFAEIRVINQTFESLICYVAINGHKIHFRLPATESSVWYKATDKRFNYTNFSTWCDYLKLYE